MKSDAFNLRIKGSPRRQSHLQLTHSQPNYPKAAKETAFTTHSNNETKY
jgi:hypothetical protein